MAKVKPTRVEPSEEQIDREWLTSLPNVELLAHVDAVLDEVRERFGRAADEFRKREGTGVPRNTVIQTLQVRKDCLCDAYRVAVERGGL